MFRLAAFIRRSISLTHGVLSIHAFLWDFLFTGSKSMFVFLKQRGRAYLPIGNLRSYDGNSNENVTLNFALSLLRLFHVDQVVQNTRIALSLAWHERFSCKGKE